MSIQQVIQHVKNFFQIAFDQNAKVIGVEKDESGWIATVEIIEESDYMRSRALDDIIGLYQVKLDDSLQITSYQRISLRERDKFAKQDEDD